MIDGMMILRTYGTELEAEMAAAMLQAYGVEALITTDDGDGGETGDPGGDAGPFAGGPAGS